MLRIWLLLLSYILFQYYIQNKEFKYLLTYSTDLNVITFLFNTPLGTSILNKKCYGFKHTFLKKSQIIYIYIYIFILLIIKMINKIISHTFIWTLRIKILHFIMSIIPYHFKEVFQNNFWFTIITYLNYLFIKNIASNFFPSK